MGKTEYNVQHAAYQAGLRAGRTDTNPYAGTARAGSWDRGHRDRWLHGIRPTVSKGPLAAKLLLAAGASAIILSLINAFTNAQT